MPETSPTLQEDCIRSAEIYLKYLEENREGGKGIKTNPRGKNPAGVHT